MVAPLYAVNGILAALISRGRTGEGQLVQVSMLDCLASMVAEEHFDVMGKAGYPMRSGNSHDRLVPFGVFPTTDGHVAIVAFSPEWMKSLADAMGQPDLPDDPRFANRAVRMQNAKAFNEIMEQWTRRHSSEHVVRELLEKRGVPVARVRTPDEVLHDPHLQETGAVVELEHPTLGKIGAFGTGMPIRFSRSEAKFDQPAQELGASNEEVYGTLLKISKDEMDALRAKGVI
jgi:crotonobetainyl-CoA:carnitine CoA-transferase CaiB-like acyl-CoA transferase